MLIKINGERNSGTRFLKQLIDQNFGCAYDQEEHNNICFYWKHGVPCNSIKQKDEKVIDIFIFRELDGWLTSMHKNSYHMEYMDLPEFLVNKQKCKETSIRDFRTNRALNLDDNNRDIFEIRYYKFNKIMEYYKTNPHVVLVNMKYLQDDANCLYFLRELNRVYQIKDGDDYTLVHTHTKEGTETKNRVYDVDINRYRGLINLKKNHVVESFIKQLTFTISDYKIEY
jgi:hypothetical protein